MLCKVIGISLVTQNVNILYIVYTCPNKEGKRLQRSEWVVPTKQELYLRWDYSVRDKSRPRLLVDYIIW